MPHIVARVRTAALLVLAMIAGLLAAIPAHSDTAFLHGGPTDFATVRDGASIALNVVIPPKCATGGPESCPAILEMAGYENGSSSYDGRTTLGQLADQWPGRPQDPPLATDSHEGTTAYHFDDDYVLVHASVRGTGCSSGEFDLFSSVTAQDGYDVIESWMPNQKRFKWNGKAGIIGHSYSGITGFMIAAEEGRQASQGHPSSLVAVSVSGLIDDLYRGITFPGGVSDVGFPVLWTLGVRPVYDIVGGSAQGIVRNGSRPDVQQQCAENIANHSRTVINDPGVQGLVGDVDNDWYRSRSLINVASDIVAPIHMTGMFDDEQTGPRFAHLFEAVTAPKRLLMSNGNHDTNVDPATVWKDRKAWMDLHTGTTATGSDPASFSCGGVTLPASVCTLFGMHLNPSNKLVPLAQKASTSFPLEDTTWTPFYLGGGQSLSAGPTATGSDSYFSGSKRQAWSFQAGPKAGAPFTTADGPDELKFVSPALTSPLAIDGPVTANLNVSATATDTEFFVQLLDIGPGGQVSYLQRGMLKASHRAIDTNRSDKDALHGNFMYRAYRPHTNPTSITPGATIAYFIEIFPVAHVFQPGHSIAIKVTAPPADDSYYAYAPKTAPSINTLFHGGIGGSRITLPVVTLTDAVAVALDCGDEWQVRCVKN